MDVDLDFDRFARVWELPAERDGDWVRTKTPCCGREVGVLARCVDGVDGMRIPHCGRGFTLTYDPSNPGGEARWREWTPDPGALRLMP